MVTTDRTRFGKARVSGCQCEHNLTCGACLQAVSPGKSRLSMTYGILPAYWEYSSKYLAEIGDGEGFRFGNDKRVGTCTLTCDELWTELVKAHGEFSETGDEAAGDWCSSVLGLLKIEWI